MNENQTVEIDLIDLVCVVLKKIGVIIVVGAIFAGLGLSYGYKAYKKASTSVSKQATNVLNVETPLPDENEQEYANRVRIVSNARGIMDNIAALNELAEVQRSYMSSSIYMELDPLHVARSSAQIILSMDYSVNMYGISNALVSAYYDDLMAGDYLESVVEETGYDQAQLSELIDVQMIRGDSFGSDVVISDASDNTLTLSVAVVGPSTDFTEQLMESILEEIGTVSNEFRSSIARHSVVVVSCQSYVSYDGDVNERQVQAVSTINSIYSQINSQYGLLDNLAKQLGLIDRNDFYESPSLTNVPESVSSRPFLVKNMLIGAVIGVFLTAAYYVIVYIFGQKILTQRQFFSLFGNIVNIGVMKPSKKRNWLVRLLDKVTNDDNKLTDDNTCRIIAANYKNLTKDMSKVLITGTACEDVAKKAVKDLGVNGDLGMNIFEGSSVLLNASLYDGIVLIEQRGLSKKREVRDEFRLLKNSGTKIIGVIIL